MSKETKKIKINKLIKFAEKNEIPYELILVNPTPRENNKPKKNPFGINDGFKDVNKLLEKYSNKYNDTSLICWKLNIFNTEYSVVDIDDGNSLEIIYETYPFLKDTFYLKGNTLGYHFYIKNDKLKKYKNIIANMNNLKNIKGDLISEFIWEDITKKIYNSKNINTISDKDLEDIYPTFCEGLTSEKQIKHIKIKPKKIKIYPTNNTPDILDIKKINKEELVEIVNNIPKKYSDNYKDWLKVLSILKKYNFYDIAKSFSRKSKKYDEIVFEDIYHNKTYNWDYDIGTLYQLSKENITNFNKIKSKYLKHDIKTQNDFSYKTVCDNFEEIHFKVTNKVIFCKFEDNTLMTFTKNKFVEAYDDLHYEKKKINKDGEEEITECSFIKKYVGVNKTIRKYKDMDVYPDPTTCPKDHFNLWFPFAVQLIEEHEEDISGLEFVLKHIMMLCKHDKNIYEYILDYFAHMFKFPEEKSDIFVLFVGLQGSGKGMLIELLANMVGSSKYLECPNPQRDVWGPHNTIMSTAYLVHYDELDWMQQKGVESLFKNIITSKHMTINPKGKDQFVVKSYHRNIGSTNNYACPIKTSDDDRRNLVIDVSNEKKNDKKYFGHLATLIASKNLQKTFYDYLMKRPNIDKFKSKKIPHTEYQDDLKESFVDCVLCFVKHLVHKRAKTSDEVDENNNHIIIQKKEKFNSTRLFEKFNNFLEKENNKFKLTHKMFSLKLMHLPIDIEGKGIEKGHNRDGIFYSFDYKLLCESLKIIFPKEDCLFSDSDSENI